MRVIDVGENHMGVADLEGTRQEINLSLVPDVEAGSYVIVHAGFAIERMNEHEANALLALFAEMAAQQASESKRS